MRWSKSPFPRRSKEEERLWVQVQKAKRAGKNFRLSINSSRAYQHCVAVGQALIAVLLILLVVALLVGPFIYFGWIINQIYKSQSTTIRNTFIKQELWRIAMMGSCLLPLYFLVDLLFSHNHRWVSLILFPLSFFLIVAMKKKFKKAKSSNRYEERKWHSRRRQKLPSQQEREEQNAA